MAISEQEWKDWGEGKPKKMTIGELKRALVEVRDLCAASWVDCVERCTLFDHDAFQCPIQNRFPSNWEIDGWKEDSNETD